MQIPNKGYNWEILSLTRFLLAFIVLTGHLSEGVDVGFLKGYALLGSFEAIFGFLLISGLSIGKSIAKNQDSYFKRRAQRIYPVYLACMVFEFIVHPHALTFPFIAFLLLNILFLNHIFTGMSFVGPAWTLATEVWLYCLAPLFLKLSLKQLFIIIYVSLLCYCMYTCGRSLWHWKYYSGTQYGVNLIFLAFIWVVGFALAVYPQSKKFISVNIALIFALHIALTAGIQFIHRYKHHEMGAFIANDIISYAAKALCLSLVYYVVIFNHKIPHPTKRIKKVFNLLGNISYPLYLVHMSAFNLLHKWHITSAVIMIGFALLVSYLIYWLFDSYSKKRDAKILSNPNTAAFGLTNAS